MNLITRGLLGGMEPPPAPTPESRPDIISAVQAYWLITPALVALTVDGRLWFLEAPETTLLPYATISLVSDIPEVWTTGYPFARASIQVNCHAHLASDARVMGETVRGLLQGAPLVIDDQPVCHCLPDGSSIAEGEGLGPGGEDCWVAMETFDVAFTS